MLKLDAMTPQEFDDYLASAVDAYARNTARAWKRPIEDVGERAAKDYAELLPEGLASPNNYLFTARVEGERVGMAWLAITQKPSGKSAYIYDNMIDEGRRGQGLGRQLLAAIEQQAIDKGAGRIGLNVFGFNTAARSLYESAGFEVGGLGMFKLLG